MGKCYSKSDKKRKINYHEQNWIKLNIETPALANYLMKKYPRIFKNYDETVKASRPNRAGPLPG